MHKPFKQVLHHEPDSLFTITGEEYSELKKLVTLSGNLNYTKIMNKIFERNLNAGVIKVKYETLDGQELSKAEVEGMIRETFEAIRNNEE
jgi:hypothetical protein